MRLWIRLLAPAAAALGVAIPTARAQSGFTLQQIKSYPFPNALTAAAHRGRIAYALNEQGKRNIWVADAPDYKPRRITSYMIDDGQELTSVSLSSDGKYVVYVRGGEHGSNWSGAPPNPMSMPNAPKVELWIVPFDGGVAKRIAEGDDPVISPKGNVVAFTHEGAVWTAPVDASSVPKKLFSANGQAGDLRWSPDGSRLAFVSDRGDHAMIGVYTSDSVGIKWLAPSSKTDGSPRWSPDGSRIAFVRVADGGAPDSVLADVPHPWAIWSADVRSGIARELWKSPQTLRGSVPDTHGGTNLNYGAGRIVFLSEIDGWPHLYSIPENGGAPLLLTPGKFMAEHVTMSADGRWLAFAGNAGSDADDVDRRHIVRVPVDRAAPEILTPGTGIEWTPVFTGDGNSIAFIGATPQRAPLPAVLSASPPKAIEWIGAEQIPSDFPAAQLVTPRKVVFKASDGLEVHGQLFEASGSSVMERRKKKPAIIYVHGGPPRQMLLGWHYSDYYSNSYASNQYLASRGFVVLSVNYRLGIGYGREFQHPRHEGDRGASEYLDVLAGAKYLQSLPQVDRTRIGIYGGSYGGFLTALALGRNSDIFATGVDIHGVHDWTTDDASSLLAPRYEKPADAQRALDIAWKSSPVSSVNTWLSPVLLIHGDDDRNVRFNQTVSLARRLEKKGVVMEEIVLPDETHHMMRHASWMVVDSATASWFERRFSPKTSLVP